MDSDNIMACPQCGIDDRVAVFYKLSASRYYVMCCRCRMRGAHMIERHDAIRMWNDLPRHAPGGDIAPLLTEKVQSVLIAALSGEDNNLLYAGKFVRWGRVMDRIEDAIKSVTGGDDE